MTLKKVVILEEKPPGGGTASHKVSVESDQSVQSIKS